ncbi:MAG: lipid-A-disaccharide synthase N-terminal domain-containing protein [Muribaculaceae bacterium]|nr:lipid-A-disaccharide synthase N-terminal domain-containing protein [Muribaculaceae bacterium]
MHPLLITCVGLLAQAFFSARTLVQWILSERARKVLSPTLFWALSLAGSALLATYGWLRADFAVVAGQIVSYYVYVWNLHLKRVRMPRICWALLLCFPVIAAIFVADNARTFIDEFLLRPDIPMALLCVGTFGQLLMTLRFVYQWWYSKRIGRSELPPLFWWISLAGAAIIFIYGIFRQDIVLLLGQGFGLVVYSRNIVLSK